MFCDNRHVMDAAGALGRVFLSARGAEGVSRLAGALPQVATGHILECRMDGPAAAADYSCVILPGEGLDLLERSGSAPMPVRAARRAEAGLLWLEYDLDDSGAHGPPSLFLAPRLLAAGREAETKLSMALFGVVGEGAPPPVGDLLLCLPERVVLRQVGAMTGRGPARALRLVLDGAAPGDLSPVLEALSWPGAPHLSRQIGALIADLRGPLRVDVDVAGGLLPTLGVEVPLPALSDPAAFASRLEAADLATPEKAQALSALAARKTLRRLETDGEAQRLDFGLNHLKLSVSGDDPATIIAKAYFSLITTPDFAAGRARSAEPGPGDGRR